MKKLVIILTAFVLAVLFGCMPFIQQSYTKYPFGAKEITLGMTAKEVREIAGTPDAIILPDAVSRAISPNGVYDKMTEGQQYWRYGSMKQDGYSISVTFKDGVVIEIKKFSKR